MNSPATTTEAPNPKPVLRGSSTNWGMIAIEPYIPIPSRKAARLVVQTPRMRIMCMSTSGSLQRSSLMIQSSTIPAPAATSPSVLTEPQPHVVAWLTPTSRAESPTVIRVAPSQLIRPGVLIGDSGT
jgi:hypothetical protein